MKPIPLLIIVGPTASGKSDLAVDIALALKHDGHEAEIISADSRQVYRGLDIGTGKITTKEMRGIPHHLLDVADPKKQFTVAQYVRLGRKAIAEIYNKGRLPIIVGGTGFYIQALIGDITLPNIPADQSLRKKLSTKTASQLLSMLKKLDTDTWKRISENNSDNKNARRILRAIEISLWKKNNRAGRVSGIEPPLSTTYSHADSVSSKIHSAETSCAAGQYNTYFVGIKMSIEEIRTRIHTRLLKRLDPKNSMITEARRLHKNGLSWKRMDALGLEYRFLAELLQKKTTKEQFIEKLATAIGQYAKRQITWFKRDERIHWIEKTALPKAISHICGQLDNILKK